MEYRRAYHMYGDKLQYYQITIYLFFLSIGWICAKYWEAGFGNIFARVLGVYIVLHLVDALVRSIVFIKDNFSLKLTLKS